MSTEATELSVSQARDKVLRRREPCRLQRRDHLRHPRPGATACCRDRAHGQGRSTHDPGADVSACEDAEARGWDTEVARHARVITSTTRHLGRLARSDSPSAQPLDTDSQGRLIERWFKELTDKRLRRGRFTNVADLTEAITTGPGGSGLDAHPTCGGRAAPVDPPASRPVRRGRHGAGAGLSAPAASTSTLAPRRRAASSPSPDDPGRAAIWRLRRSRRGLLVDVGIGEHAVLPSAGRTGGDDQAGTELPAALAGRSAAREATNWSM